MIPKVCYFYWENETMSFLRYMSIRSFIFHNPNFKVVLITKHKQTGKRASIYKETQDISIFTGKCYWDECKKLDIEIQYLEDDYPEIARLHLDTQYNSDILAWYILGTKGGFVADTDIIFTNPINYEEYKDVDVSLFAYDNNFAIGFLFGQPNDIWLNLFQQAKFVHKNNYQSIGGMLIRNFFIQFGNPFPNYNVRFISNKLVYPYVHTMSWKESLEYPWINNKPVEQYTCGIHWYGGFPMSQEFNNKITMENYKEFNNTISYYIGVVLDESTRNN